MSSDRIARFTAEGEPTGGGGWRRFAELCEALATTRSKLAKRAAMAEYLRPLDTATAGLAEIFRVQQVL